jgi:hypothetical protein
MTENGGARPVPGHSSVARSAHNPQDRKINAWPRTDRQGGDALSYVGDFYETAAAVVSFKTI